MQAMLASLSLKRIFRSATNAHSYVYFVNGQAKLMTTQKDDFMFNLAELFGALAQFIFHGLGVKNKAAFLMLLAAAVSSTAVLSANADANLPTGFDPNQSHGVGSVVTNGNNMGITTTTNNSLGSFGTFNIGAGYGVNVAQPGANAMFIANVRDLGAPSTIYGSLTSNGGVGIVNPAGVFVGASGIVNTGGFLATTQQLDQAKFLAGSGLSFAGSGDGSASVINQGLIQVARNGFVVLAAPNVSNSGTIIAPEGSVSLVSASHFSLITRDGVALHLDVPSAFAPSRSGFGASDSLFSGIVNNTGRIYANSVSENGKGEIVLMAVNGTASNDGLLDASGDLGGNIDVFGDTVSVNGTIDASGLLGGGSIRLGGDYQGKNASVLNSSLTTLGASGVLLANAVDSGNGGRVILWSDGTTNHDGTIEAKGGTASGDGGFVEISGKQILNFTALANVDALNGEVGSILVDPTNIVIDAAKAALINTTNGNLSFLTDAAGAEEGDILINSAINRTRFGSLTFTALRDVVVNQNVTTLGNLNLAAGRDVQVKSNVIAGSNLKVEAVRNLDFTATSNVTAQNKVTLSTNTGDATQMNLANLAGSIKSTLSDITITADDGINISGSINAGRNVKLETVTDATDGTNNGRIILSNASATEITAAQDVEIKAAGNIIDANDAATVDIAGRNIVLSGKAIEGVGDTDGYLNTAVERVQATSTVGNVKVSDVDDLTLLESTAAGDLDIKADGSLLIARESKGNNVYLKTVADDKLATGGAARDIIFRGEIKATNTAIVTADDNVVDRNGLHDVTAERAEIYAINGSVVGPANTPTEFFNPYLEVDAKTLKVEAKKGDAYVYNFRTDAAVDVEASTAKGRLDLKSDSKMNIIGDLTAKDIYLETTRDTSDIQFNAQAIADTTSGVAVVKSGRDILDNIENVQGDVRAEYVTLIAARDIKNLGLSSSNPNPEPHHFDVDAKRLTVQAGNDARIWNIGTDLSLLASNAGNHLIIANPNGALTVDGLVQAKNIDLYVKNNLTLNNLLLGDATEGEVRLTSVNGSIIDGFSGVPEGAATNFDIQGKKVFLSALNGSVAGQDGENATLEIKAGELTANAGKRVDVLDVDTDGLLLHASSAGFNPLGDNEYLKVKSGGFLSVDGLQKANTIFLTNLTGDMTFLTQGLDVEAATTAVLTSSTGNIVDGNDTGLSKPVKQKCEVDVKAPTLYMQAQGNIGAGTDANAALDIQTDKLVVYPTFGSVGLASLSHTMGSVINLGGSSAFETIQVGGNFTLNSQSALNVVNNISAVGDILLATAAGKCDKGGSITHTESSKSIFARGSVTLDANARRGTEANVEVGQSNTVTAFEGDIKLKAKDDIDFFGKGRTGQDAILTAGGKICSSGDLIAARDITMSARKSIDVTGHNEAGRNASLTTTNGTIFIGPKVGSEATGFSNLSGVFANGNIDLTAGGNWSLSLADDAYLAANGNITGKAGRHINIDGWVVTPLPVVTSVPLPEGEVASILNTSPLVASGEGGDISFTARQNFWLGGVIRSGNDVKVVAGKDAAMDGRMLAGNTISVSAIDNVTVFKGGEVGAVNNISLLANQAPSVGDAPVSNNEVGNLFIRGSVGSVQGNIALEGIDVYLPGIIRALDGDVSIKTGNGPSRAGFLFQDGYLAGQTLTLDLGSEPLPEMAFGSEGEFFLAKAKQPALGRTIGYGGGWIQNADFATVTGSSLGDLSYEDSDGFTATGLTMAEGTNLRMTSFSATLPKNAGLPSESASFTALGGRASNGLAETTLIVNANALGVGISGGNAVQLIASNNAGITTVPVVDVTTPETFVILSPDEDFGEKVVVLATPFSSTVWPVGVTETAALLVSGEPIATPNLGIQINGPVTAANLIAADVRLPGAGLDITSLGSVATTNENSNVLLRADSINVGGSVTSGNIYLAPTTGDTPIFLGLDPALGGFNLTQSEFNNLNAGSIVIGLAPSKFSTFKPRAAQGVAFFQRVAYGATCEDVQGGQYKALRLRDSVLAREGNFNPNDVFAYRGSGEEGNTTTGNILVGSVDLGGKTGTNLTLNTTGTVQDADITDDTTANINLGAGGNLFLTGGVPVTQGEGGLVFDYTNGPGVGVVGAPGSLGDLDVTQNGLIDVPNYIFVNRGGNLFSGPRIDNAVDGLFINIPGPVTFASFSPFFDGNNLANLKSLGNRLRGIQSSLITNEINGSTTVLEARNYDNNQNDFGGIPNFTSQVIGQSFGF
jgi:filamentous hemagglutinin family protein